MACSDITVELDENDGTVTIVPEDIDGMYVPVFDAFVFSNASRTFVSEMLCGLLINGTIASALHSHPGQYSSMDEYPFSRLVATSPSRYTYDPILEEVIAMFLSLRLDPA